MPWIIDYERVLERMTGSGFQCVYHNSGAFSFADTTQAHYRGWVGAFDQSIRPEMRPLTRLVSPPVEQNLSKLAVEAWKQFADGPVWLMPKSHWSYELQFGSRDWMPAVLEHAGIDPGHLVNRTNAAALEFASSESASLQYIVGALLQMLLGSDFMLAWPGRSLLCTVHHHKQLWWAASADTVSLLDALGPSHAMPGLPK